MFTPELFKLIGDAFVESLYMILGSMLLAYVIGLPVGLLLAVTDRDGVRPNAAVNNIVGVIVNILRSIPFIILLVWVMPVTRAVCHTTVGSGAAMVPLVISAAPFIARMVESSAREIDRGVIEASLSMGASTMQIVIKVMLPEAKPSLITGAAISITTILGYSAMAGMCGGGGLGAVAINYGYYRGNQEIMTLMVVIIVIIVQIFQEVGSRLSSKTDKRIR